MLSSTIFFVAVQNLSQACAKCALSDVVDVKMSKMLASAFAFFFMSKSPKGTS